MSWLYCHHKSELKIKHLIVRGTVTADRLRENVRVKTFEKSGRFFNPLSGGFYTWSYIYVMDLNSGREYYWRDGMDARDDAKPWIFDPLIRAIKVAELTKKHQKRRRLTRLNKVVKLPKQNRKTGKK